MTTETQKQFAVQDELTSKMDDMIYGHLLEYFNDATEEYERQAVIEVMQEYGFIDDAIRLMGILDRG